MILGLVAVAVVAAALWVWHEGSHEAHLALAPANVSAPIEDSIHQSAPALAPVEPVPPASPPERTAGVPTTAAAVPDVGQNATAAQGEPPNVDTPEPAQRKFAHGATADEAGQN
jgi:hypothetical protein